MSRAEGYNDKAHSGNFVPLAGIGASAGGLEAFKKFLGAIPKDSGMAYVFVQHPPAGHESALAGILQKATAIPVEEITDKTHIEPDRIYVAPPDKLVVIDNDSLRLKPRSPKGKQNTSIDVFFSSIAEAYQSAAVGVVLSGTGMDGTAGLKDIRDHGGLAFAQDPDSAHCPDMPQSAIDAQTVDFVLPPEKIPGQLLALKESLTHIPVNEEVEPYNEPNEEGFRRILFLLRVHQGVDFTNYKQTTIRRRIIRRMVILKLEQVSDYLNYLRQDRAELEALFQDLLIPVTSFFRDPEAFGKLGKKVLPDLIKNKSPDNPLRIWVAGCSTGQEAYSLAICLYELLSDAPSSVKVQIFASDISERSIGKARSGLYHQKELEGLSETRIHRFFDKTGRYYQIKKHIRDWCVFATHNLLKDPPFAKIDIISCRNVLIYLEPFLQKKVLSTFHYALNEKGVLWLGKTESTGSASDLFASLDKKSRLYTRKAVPSRFMMLPNDRREALLMEKNYAFGGQSEKTDDFQKIVDDVLLQEYTPAGVVVNEQYDIVQFRGSTGDYLEPAPGKASLNVLKMARGGLSFEIRNAIHKAETTGETIRKRDIPINDGRKLVAIEVIPLSETIDPYYLILFKENAPVSDGKSVENYEKDGDIHPRKSKPDVKDLRIRQLERELSQLRKDMRGIIEDLEATNEELQSANEELLSSSEELQILNEELEAGKEELQKSTHEKLATINRELSDRNEQLNQSRQFAEIVIETLHEPFLVLDQYYRIRSASNSFYETFGLTEEETLGTVLFDLQNKGWNIPGLRKKLAKVQQEKEKNVEVEIAFSFPYIGKRTIVFNIQPIRRDNKEQLILLALDDVTVQREAENARRRNTNVILNERRLLQSIFMQAPAMLCILNGPDHVYEMANKPYRKLVDNRDIIGKPIKEALPEIGSQGFIELLDEVYRTGKPFIGREASTVLLHNGKPKQFFLNFSYQPFKDAGGKTEGIFVFCYDVTEQVVNRKAIEESEKKYRELIIGLPTAVYTCDARGYIQIYNKAAVQLWGREPDIGKDLWCGSWKIFRTDGTPLPLDKCPMALALKEGKTSNMEILIQRPDGEQRYVIPYPKITYDAEGKITGAVNTLVDITEQKLKEQQKDEFIGIASHEMKTPLTSAKAYLQLLESTLDKGDEEAATYAKKATYSIERLHSLIKELLDVNKIQHGKLPYHFSRFDFNEMVDNAIDSIQHTSPKHKLIKRGKTKDEVTGDKERLQQVLMNLLSNAVKYSPDAEQVFITVEQKNDEVTVAVRDEGIGLSPGDLTKIFDRYYRVEYPNTVQFKGLGIGLFLSYEIIQRHNGRLWVESERGKGSTFYFKLPVKQTFKPQHRKS